MWSKTLSRQRLTEALGAVDRYDSVSLEVEEGFRNFPERDEVAAVWLGATYDRTALPHLLVVKDDRISEFLAFTATFLTSLRPLTAYIRLIPSSIGRVLLSEEPRPVLLEETLVGAIIGEVLTEVRSRAAFETLAVNSFISTYSYSMARCTALYEDRAIFEDVSTAWFAVREWTQQPGRKLDPSRLREVWDILFCLVRQYGTCENVLSPGGSILLKALRSLSVGDLEQNSWEPIGGSLVPFELVVAMATEPREDRVRSVEIALEKLSSKSPGGYFDDFIVGYVLSLLSNGTLDHAEMLFSELDRFPTGLIWYGVCSALNKGGRLDGWRRGLQRRLNRDIGRPLTFEGRPTADVSVSEFEVLLRGKDKGKSILQTNAKTLSIELVPGVEQLVMWPRQESIASPRNDVLIETRQEFEAIMKSCQTALSRLDGVAVPNGLPADNEKKPPEHFVTPVGKKKNKNNKRKHR